MLSTWGCGVTCEKHFWVQCVGHQNNSKPRPGNAITHKFSKKSPLSIDEAKKKEENIKKVATMKKGNVIKSLDAYLSKRGSEKKSLIKETNGNKSIMDPEILMDE